MTVTDRCHLGLYDKNFQIWEVVAPKTTSGTTNWCYRDVILSPLKPCSTISEGFSTQKRWYMYLPLG